MQENKMYSTRELAELLSISQQAIIKKAQRENWQSKPRLERGGGYYWLFNSMPESTQLAIRLSETKKLPQPQEEQIHLPKPQEDPAVYSEKKKELAAYRADLLRLYSEFQEQHGKTVKAKELFMQKYHEQAYPQLFEKIGDISWKTLERWKNKQKKAKSIFAIADKRGIAQKGKSFATEKHISIILGQILNPNAPLISQAIRKIQNRFEENGLFVLSEASIRRFVNKFISESYDEFILFREGKKAWNDKCSISILRDWSLVNVGDVVIADGHTLNFETINPETGKPKRMTLLLFFDGASNHPLGWEIMATENVQCISAAFRRTCLLLGKFPKVVYLDNGRAFRARFFEGCKDLQQEGIDGLYESLGVKVIHAWPYHGQSKPIERFFGTMLDMEVYTPSYVGNSIQNKPARLHRNEKLHQKLHEKAGGRPLTLEETHIMIAKWFYEYANRSQPRTHLKGKSPYQVFEAGKGQGLSQTEIDRLDMLMMQKEIRTITKDGLRLNGKLYWHEILASRRHEVLVRYDDLLSPNCLKVYTKDGEFLCTALERKSHNIAFNIHSAASVLGTKEQQQELENALALKKNQERTSMGTLKNLVEDVVLPEAKIRNTITEIKRAAPLPHIEQKSLSQKDILAIEEAKKKAQEQQKPSYVPSSLKHFRDSLERYSYLFDICYHKNIELVSDDKAWMEFFEQTPEYKRNYEARFLSLRSFYQNQQTA